MWQSCARAARWRLGSDTPTRFRRVRPASAIAVRPAACNRPSLQPCGREFADLDARRNVERPRRAQRGIQDGRGWPETASRPPSPPTPLPLVGEGDAERRPPLTPSPSPESGRGETRNAGRPHPQPLSRKRARGDAERRPPSPPAPLPLVGRGETQYAGRPPPALSPRRARGAAQQAHDPANRRGFVLAIHQDKVLLRSPPPDPWPPTPGHWPPTTDH